MTYAIARRRGSNGDSNRLLPEDRAVHDWYRFVLSYPPHLVRDYLERFGLGAGQCVLDPFCGTGTTLVEAKKLGIASVGTEFNPMPKLASEVKTDWQPDPGGLLRHAEQVADAAYRELQDIGDVPDASRRNGHRALESLPPERQDLLLANSLSPLPMHKALVLLRAIDAESHPSYHRHERLALAKSLVFSSSNLHFGPEVGVSAPKSDAPVVGPWLAGVQAMAHDLEQVRHQAAVPSRVYRADARQLTEAIAPASIDAVITSPPYPNEKDYTRTTRLESVLLGYVTSKAELQMLKRGLVRSNTRGVYTVDDDDLRVAHHPEIGRIAEEIEARRIQMGKTSGFERMYARVTRLYFGGMVRHLDELRRVLRPGARLAYVVGDQASYLRVMIRTGTILADLAEQLGYTVESIDLFRTRLATATGEQLREEVVVLRWRHHRGGA